ncbi:MAG: rod shape-determining protein [Actinobacteria bacterium]|nr:rod shape-determining protein [Actinomycetota bacterium]MBU4403788.1 rod shape-determining protein [Actinomycetota bacterium]MCG2819286.1 rod shape-determining protein [Actinomycetes bacterium]
MLERLQEAGAFGKDMAVDLGTVNTRVYVKGEGIVLNEPSVVAVNTMTNEIVAVGEEAMRMVGRSPAHIVVVRPLRAGVSTDFDVTEKMLRYFIQKVRQRRSLARPRLLVAVPTGITGVEKRAVEDASIQAGARLVSMIEGPLAAAIGAGIPVHEPMGNMVVDIGGGTTEVAVLSLGGTVISRSIRLGGDKMDEAIIGYIQRGYELMIGERTAELLKVNIGSAFELDDDGLEDEINGRDLASGLPKTIVVTAREIRESIEESIGAIIQTVKDALDQTPPELASDIMDRGVTLSGGGALLRGIDRRIRNATGIAVHTAKHPLLCVVMGAGKCLEEFDNMKEPLIYGVAR